MRWTQGNRPTDNGIYLCAVAGESHPIVMGWFNDNWIVDGHIPIINQPNVIYFIKPSDIPMPEDW